MAQDAVNAILEGLKTHQAKVLEQTRLAIEKQRADAATEAEKARIEQQKNQLEQAKKQFDANHELAKKAADLMHVQVTSKLGQQYQETGITPAGTTISPAIQGNGGMASPVNPSAATSQMLDIPNIGQIQVATPEAYATRQADLSRITEKPKEEAKIRESRALQEDLLKKQEESKQADFVRSVVQKQYDDARAAATQTAETERAKMHIASAERIAKMQMEGKTTSGIDLTPFAQRGLDGDLTVGELNKQPLTIKDKAAIVGAVNAAGGKLLTDKQGELISGFNQITAIFPYMDDLIANQAQTHNYTTGKIGGALTSLSDAVRVPEKELTARATVLGRFLRDNKVSNADVTRVLNMIPSRFNSVDANIKLRDNFRVELNRLIDSQLHDVSPKQLNIFKKKIGLLDVGPLNNPQQNVSAPTGGSGQLSPAAQQLMQKYNIQ